MNERMTLTEAIEYAKSVTRQAETERLEAVDKEAAIQCAWEHEDLATWLEELVRLRAMTTPILCSERLPDIDDNDCVQAWHRGRKEWQMLPLHALRSSGASYVYWLPVPADPQATP